MKKSFIYTGMLLLGIIVATSCSNEEFLEQMASNGNTVQAVIENEADTRTSVNDSYQVVWTAEDKFDVWDGETFKGVLKLKDGAGTTSASFIDNDDSNPVGATAGMTAFFPSYDDESNNNKKAFVFPETYNSQETDAPMLGSYDGSKFTFSLLTAMVRVVVADVPAGEIVFTISAKNNEILTGEAALGSENKLSVPTQGETSVSVNFTTNEAKTLTFDVPIPVQDYVDGLQVVVKSGETDVLNKKTNAFEAVAGKLYLFGATYVYVADADAASEKLESDEVTAVKVQSVEADDEIAIPAKSETSAQTEHIIDLSEAAMPSEGSVTIKVTEASTDGTESTVEKLTVIVPDGTESTGNLVINAPGTTVTIQSTSGTVIETIEATTADQTLIIGAGVTVKSLTINKGNVELENGAKVELFKVSDAAGFKTAVSLGGKVELIKAIDLDLNSSNALTIASGNEVSIDLKNFTLTTSKTYVGIDDITVIGTLNISNGTIETANAAFWVKAGKLNLTDCTISSSSTLTAVYVSDSGQLEATNCTANVVGTAFKAVSGSMTLNDCTVTTSHENGYANVTVTGQGTTLKIDGGSYTGVETDYLYDLYVIEVRDKATATINTTVGGGNGGVTVIGGSTATLTGGSYTGLKACGLYVAGGSTVTYNNCTFSGVEGNVVVGGGTYGAGTVNGTTYTEYTKFVKASTIEEVEAIVENGGNAIWAICLTNVLTVDGDVTIDLKNNKLITSQTVTRGDDIIVTGTLNISNGTIVTANAAFWVKGGNLKLNGCVLNSSSDLVTVYVSDKGQLEATNCTANVVGTAFKAVSGSMTLEGCTVTTSHENGYANVTVTGQGTTLKIDGGSYTGKETNYLYDLYVIEVRDKATATINTTVDGGNGGVTVIGGSTATLTGGSYTGLKACGLYINDGSTVTYENCTFKGAEGNVVVGPTGGQIGSTTYNQYTKVQ